MLGQPQSLLHITKSVAIPPLVKLHHPQFQKWYRLGVWWCHHEREDEGPLDGRYLASCLLQHMEHGNFDGGQQHDNELYQWIGFYLGMIHGGVLLPDGTGRRDVTALVTLDDTQTRRGYEAGRTYFFLDARTDEERNQTDSELIERIKRYATEHMAYRHEPLAYWYFTIGNILGEFSGHIFPWTREEHRAYEEESIKLVGYVCKLPQGCLAARMYSPVATF